MWTKIKSIGWVKIIGMALSAAVLGVAVQRATNKKDQAAKMEEKAVGLQNSAISKEIQAGKKLMEKSQIAKDKGVEIHTQAEQQLEKMGKANEDMDTIATKFNSKRVRL
jgi:hypothetical protein